MKKLLTTVAAALLAMSTAASAATLTIDGGDPGLIPGGTAKNDVLADMTGDPSATLAGYYGSKILLSGNSTIRVELLGFEAGFNNTFTLGGSSLATATFDPDNTVLPSELLTLFASFPGYEFAGVGGLLDFSFNTTGPGGTVSNGDANINAINEPNFFATVEGDPTGRSGSSLLLFFDDAGAGSDDNHDDLVIRISAVPVPAGVLTLLTAMGAFGAVGVRRRRKAATA